MCWSTVGLLGGGDTDAFKLERTGPRGSGRSVSVAPVSSLLSELQLRFILEYPVSLQAILSRSIHGINEPELEEEENVEHRRQRE
jgi:hypothetical protein